MIIYAIDDEQNALEYITDKIRQAAPDADVHAFSSPREALASMETQPFDVAFLDIQMPGINGISLAKKFKQINPKCNFIFVTGYSEYTMDAFALDASGYLLKPATAKQVAHALENLRYPVVQGQDEKLTIHCFGNFEVFWKGEPVRFKYSKSKEVLAYLTDRNGAVCTNNEVIAALWEDDDHANYYRSLQKDIQDTLGALGCKDVIHRQWGGSALKTDRVACDYYDYLKGLPSGINAWHGEYMTQYSWAEETGASLWNDD